MKKMTTFLFSVCLALQLVAQEQHYFMNPVIRGDMPDPSIIRIDDTYYATGTSSEWAPFYPVFTSKERRIADSLGQSATSGIASLRDKRDTGRIYLFQHAKPEIDGTE